MAVISLRGLGPGGASGGDEEGAALPGRSQSFGLGVDAEGWGRSRLIRWRLVGWQGVCPLAATSRELLGEREGASITFLPQLRFKKASKP